LLPSSSSYKVYKQMFTPWIKRKALKRNQRSKTLIVSGESPSRIMLLSLSALCVMVGVYVVQQSYAQTLPAATPSPTPVVSPTPSPTPTPY
jgi:hypothetical protein